MSIRPITIISLILSLVLAGDKEHKGSKKNQFIGSWNLDVDRTIFENPSLSMESHRDLVKQFSDHVKITFRNEGEFQETISNHTINGQWSRYDDHLAVVRLESDPIIMKERRRLKNRIDIDSDRYSRTRDHQRLYRLNRASVRKYHLSDGRIVQEVDLGDRVIRIFLKRAS
jgi:hypothetical protein